MAGAAPTSPTPTPTTPTPSPTDPPPTTTPPPAGGDCDGHLQGDRPWQGGFQGDVTITNHGSSALSGWTASWTWPNGQAISQIWGATQTSSGSSVTATNVAYNGTVAPSGTATFGFLASSTGTNGSPTVSLRRPLTAQPRLDDQEVCVTWSNCRVTQTS